MLKNNWKKVEIITSVVLGIVVFGFYLYSVLTIKPIMPYHDIITLPVTGVSMPYWLFTGLGFIILPGFTGLLLYSLLDKIKEKCF